MSTILILVTLSAVASPADRLIYFALFGMDLIGGMALLSIA